MIYGDEQILSNRFDQVKKMQLSFDDSVKINDIEYTFERYEFPPYFVVTLPGGMETMDPTFARCKYPREARPEIILTDKSTTINFAFSLYEKDGKPLEQRIQHYIRVIKRINPANVFFKKGVYENENAKIAHYDYRSFAMDCDIYNLSFFSDFDNYQFFGWFNCPFYSRQDWEPIVRKVIQTLSPYAPPVEKDGD